MGGNLTTAWEFIREAKDCPLGRNLVTAVGTAAQDGSTLAKNQGIKEIKELMKEAGVTNPKELAKAGNIFTNVLQFLQNTDFNPDSLPPHKY